MIQLSFFYNYIFGTLIYNVIFFSRDILIQNRILKGFLSFVSLEAKVKNVEFWSFSTIAYTRTQLELEPKKYLPPPHPQKIHVFLGSIFRLSQSICQQHVWWLLSYISTMKKYYFDIQGKKSCPKLVYIRIKNVKNKIGISFQN